MRRGGFLKRYTRLKPMSDKKRAELAQRPSQRARILARDGGCRGRFVVPEVACWGHYDLDEIKPRGVGGDALDDDNVQILCRAHHDWKHQNPDEARARGLRLDSWEEV